MHLLTKVLEVNGGTENIITTNILSIVTVKCANNAKLWVGLPLKAQR